MKSKKNVEVKKESAGVSDDSSGEWDTIGSSGKAPVWDFEKDGESIEGVFTSVSIDVGRNKSRLYEITTPDGEVYALWGSTVLDSRMESVAVGDYIRITYKGKETSNRTGRTVKIFDLKRKRTEPVEVDDIVDREQEPF